MSGAAARASPRAPTRCESMPGGSGCPSEATAAAARTDRSEAARKEAVAGSCWACCSAGGDSAGSGARRAAPATRMAGRPSAKARHRRRSRRRSRSRAEGWAVRTCTFCSRAGPGRTPGLIYYLAKLRRRRTRGRAGWRRGGSQRSKVARRLLSTPRVADRVGLGVIAKSQHWTKHSAERGTHWRGRTQSRQASCRGRGWPGFALPREGEQRVSVSQPSSERGRADGHDMRIEKMSVHGRPYVPEGVWTRSESPCGPAPSDDGSG